MRSESRGGRGIGERRRRGEEEEARGLIAPFGLFRIQRTLLTSVGRLVHDELNSALELGDLALVLVVAPHRRLDQGQHGGQGRGNISLLFRRHEGEEGGGEE